MGLLEKGWAEEDARGLRGRPKRLETTATSRSARYQPPRFRRGPASWTSLRGPPPKGGRGGDAEAGSSPGLRETRRQTLTCERSPSRPLCTRARPRPSAHTPPPPPGPRRSPLPQAPGHMGSAPPSASSSPTPSSPSPQAGPALRRDHAHHSFPPRPPFWLLSGPRPLRARPAPCPPALRPWLPEARARTSSPTRPGRRPTPVSPRLSAQSLSPISQGAPLRRRNTLTPRSRPKAPPS